MKNSLILGVVVAVAVYLVGNSVKSGQPTTRPTSRPTTKPAATLPAGAIDLGVGGGVYLKYTTKPTGLYAGVVMLADLVKPGPVKVQPDFYWQAAKFWLNQKDGRRWLREEKIESGGYVIFVFRLMSEEEMKKAKEAADEMSKPLPR